ncbi:MAG TPA: hypothetical protein VL651_15470, partial [Bacteroidia bacterium]|nr:hypothetical protein [Bacteroidia bacterium]
MIELQRIMPECFADTLLVRMILQRGRPGHRKGISSVAKALVEYDHNAHFVIGVADTDKFKRDSQNPNIQKFKIIVENKIEEQGLLIVQIPGTQKYLIRIHPDFEPWIWALAKTAGIKTEDFGYSNIDDLKSATKSNEVDENKNLKDFIWQVIKANPP